VSAGAVRTFVVPGRVELVGQHVDYAGVLDLSSRADVALVASRLAGVVPRP